MGSAQLTDYKVGTIVTDMFDTKSKTLAGPTVVAGPLETG